MASKKKRGGGVRDKKSYRNRRKSKRRDRKVELSDSPEIPDRRETSDFPGPPSGQKMGPTTCRINKRKK